jgi:hypothetical protein
LVRVFPSCPWDRSRNFRAFANSGFRFNPRAVTASLSSFTLSFRVHQRSSCLPLASVSRDASSAPPVESLAPSVSPHMGQRPFPDPGLHGRSICTSRFSQPPGAFIRPTSAGLVSCRIHAWGFTLQSFPPLVQPYAVSDALALLSLRRPSFRPVSHRPSDFSVSCGLGLRLSERPSPSGLCSAPESATSSRRFRPSRAHGSPGLSRPPGFSPSPAQPGLHPISPLELSGLDFVQPQPKLRAVGLDPGSPGFPFPARLAQPLHLCHRSDSGFGSCRPS